MSTRGNGERSRVADLRRLGGRALIAGAVAAGSLLALTGPAHAVTSVSVPGSDPRIEPGDESDDIDVVVSGSRLIFTDDGDTITAIAPCELVSASQVACPGTGITVIRG
ncbi:hypothetical protein [Nonomuraea sp. NPDC049480]|uniref:hypothetical protein n=1 Tax=Nonomuraea sp. NPDC049480 TaxID=3364353 RepID=UPI0037B36D60